MKKYVAFLRGINVGGHRKIRMAELRKSMEELGFKNVKTYIQSGNVIFDSDMKHWEAIAESIAEKIEADYGFDVPAIVFEKEEFRNYVNFNPFRETDSADNQKDDSFEFYEEEDEHERSVYFIFLSKEADIENQLQLSEVDTATTQYFLHERVLYLSLAEPYHQAKFTHKTVEKYLELKATARNLNTVEKLVELLGE